MPTHFWRLSIQMKFCILSMGFYLFACYAAFFFFFCLLFKYFLSRLFCVLWAHRKMCTWLVGVGAIFNPKIYDADFGTFKQGFLIMKLIQIVQNVCHAITESWWFGRIIAFLEKTLPKAQRTRWLSSYHKFLHKSLSNFIFRISIKH